MPSRPAGPNDLLLFERWMETTRWLLDRTARFPKHLRHTLTNRLESLAIGILEDVTSAAYRKNRGPTLRKANDRLNRLRVLLRLAHELQVLSHGPYEEAARREEGLIAEGGTLGSPAGGLVEADGRPARPASRGAVTPLAPPTFADVYGFRPLLAAFERARRAKRGKGGEPAFYRDLEANVLQLSDDLRTRRYRPDRYRYFHLRGRPSRKDRIVSEASFRDRVVHHALVAAIEPPFEAHFIRHSYACRKGRGTHAAIRAAQRLAGRLPYFLRLDVTRYFDHVDHDVLLALLAERLADAGIQWLCRTLLDGALVPGVPAGERRGIPIGNLTSQFWANVYLDPLDHLVRDDLGHGAYLRYVDDIAVFAHTKEALWTVARDVRGFLRDRLRLALKDRATVVAPVTEGLPWLGFRLFPGLVRIDHEGRRRFGRRLGASVARAAAAPLADEDEVARTRSLCGHLDAAQACRLRQDVLARVDAAARVR